MFNIDFLAYSLVSIKTGVEAPNMNSIMEWFFRTVRREALDNFLLLGRDQIQGILEEYIVFYDTQRPHRGIRQQIPKPAEAERTAVPSARLPCSVDYTTAIRDRRHDVRNQLPLRVTSRPFALQQ